MKSAELQIPRPFNFDENDEDFAIFKNIPLLTYQEPRVEFLKNVRVSSNSVVFNYFKIFAESCIHEQAYHKYQQGYKFFLKYARPKFNFSKKRFLLITDEWTSNYYHWHFYALSRLVVLKEQDLVKDSILILPKKYQKFSWVLPSLAKFGIGEKQILFLPNKSNVRVKELVMVADFEEHHPLIVRKLREIILTESSSGNERIYISRKNSAHRFVENEQEVITILEKYGFKTVLAEKLSYQEQIAIFTKAKYLVSSHGAGLANMFFMRQGGYVLELTAVFSSKAPINSFCRLAAILNLNYIYQECVMGESTKYKTLNPHEGSFFVDLKSLERNLRLMQMV
jgi:capsular polysaccharide biosynthesis protein